jgi:hypothetical protein
VKNNYRWVRSIEKVAPLAENLEPVVVILKKASAKKLLRDEETLVTFIETDTVKTLGKLLSLQGYLSIASVRPHTTGENHENPKTGVRDGGSHGAKATKS